MEESKRWRKDIIRKLKIYLNNLNYCHSLTSDYIYSNTSTVGSINSINNQKTQSLVIAKGDSGASDNFFREVDSHCLVNVKPHNTPPVMFPDATVSTGSEKG